MNSTQYGMILVERRLLEYVTEAETLVALKSCADRFQAQLEDITKTACIDNRDLTLLQNLLWEDDEGGVIRDAFCETTAMLDQYWFKMRLNMLTVITKMVHIGLNTKAKDNSSEVLTGLERDLTSWKKSQKLWRNMVSQPLKETPYFGVYPSRYTRCMQLSIPDYLTEEVEPVIKLMKEKDGDSAMGYLKRLHVVMVQHTAKLMKTLEDSVSTFQKDPSFKQDEVYLLDFNFALEYFSFSKIILAVAITTTKQEHFRDIKGKSFGKKGLSGKVSSITQCILDNLKILTKLIKKLTKIFCEEYLQLREDSQHKWIRDRFDPTREAKFLVEAFPTSPELAYLQIPDIRDGQWAALLEMSKLPEEMIRFIKRL